MFGFGESRDAYQQVEDGNHASLSHEAIAAAASFEAMKAFENHQRREGESVSHGTAKELIAGFAGVAVDRFVEGKGMDYLDAEKAKRHARQNADQLYDSHYGGQPQYDPSMQPPREVQECTTLKAHQLTLDVNY